MKKYLILFFIVIMAIATISYLYFNYIVLSNTTSSINKNFEKILDKTIKGTELATYINQILDKDTKNNVEKDDKGYYIDNNENSIIAEIKFIDSDNIFRIEQIANKGIGEFINLYANFNFKCTKIEYHNKTKLISYLYFEEVYN